MAPELTVIVPSYNRRGPLLHLMASLAQQDLNPDRFEVVVVLDGSNDGSAEALESLTFPAPMDVISQDNQGIAAALNRGAAKAQGTYLLFVGDDMEFFPGALEAHLEAHAKSPGAAVLGRLDIAIEHGGLPCGEKTFWRRVDATLSREGAPVPLSMFYGGNMSIGADLFRRVGRFDSSLRRSEDVEFGYRLQRAGVPIVYARGAHGLQHYSKTSIECLRDSFTKGRDRVRIWREDPDCSAALRSGGAGGRNSFECRVARVLATLPLPAPVLRCLGRLPDRVPGADRWYQALHMHAYLRGVRSVTPRYEEWASFLSRSS